MTSAPGGSGGWALATASGKDATLALLRAREAGLRVERSVTLHGSGGRVRFHGVPGDLVEAQSRALGLDPVVRGVEWEALPEAWDDLLGGLAGEGLEGMVFGNLHLADVRGWYEERVAAAGLAHREPLWEEPPEAVAREVVDRGFEAVIVAVDGARLDPGWLGLPLTHEAIDAFLEAGIDPCGEFGEYHTFVHDGPGFRQSVDFTPGGTRTDGTVRVLRLDPPSDSSRGRGC